MKIYSWNVNGFRSILKKGFLDIIQDWDADFLCLQEVKMDFKQSQSLNFFDPKVNPIIKDYHIYWHDGSKKGYSGVSIFSKKKAFSVDYSFCQMLPLFEDEGRILGLSFEKFFLINIYFPNGHPRKIEPEVLGKKLVFYDHLYEYLDFLEKHKKPIIIVGDYNVAHQAIDLARPEENEESIGFLPEERLKIDLLCKKKYIDVFRYIYPNKTEDYTWWSYRTRARDRNVGWRLDYFFISEFIKEKVKKVEHLQGIYGSDHCPILLEVDL